MISDGSNDNGDVGEASDGDSRAAMLLVESLIHGLIDRGVLGVVDAVEIVDRASEVSEEVAATASLAPAVSRRSLALLSAISASLARDIPRD